LDCFHYWSKKKKTAGSLKAEILVIFSCVFSSVFESKDDLFCHPSMNEIRDQRSEIKDRRFTFHNTNFDRETEEERRATKDFNEVGGC
jgi:hypothetical protein